MRRGAAPNHHGHPPWLEMERLLLRSVLQDALSEVVKVHPPTKLKVFVDNITACLEVRNIELPEIAETLLKTRKGSEGNASEAVDHGGKEGKNRSLRLAATWKRSFRNAAKEQE